jgi:2-phospho-L-lactate transferase/gluconeogenesis factor (CofD/UPF0052 family)
MVPDLRDALVQTRSRKVLALNLVAQPGETEGFSPQRHLEVLGAHAPDLTVDFVLANAGTVADPEALRGAAKRLGAELVLDNVAAPDGQSDNSQADNGQSNGSSGRHDPELLAAAYDRIFRMHGRIAPWR